MPIRLPGLGGPGRHPSQRRLVARTVLSTLPRASDGTLSVTDAADTLVSAVAVAIAATSSVTDSADTLSAAVAVSISATASSTDAADTLTAAAALALAATSSSTDAADTTSAAAAAAISATLSSTDAADTLASTASAAIAATLSATDANDTLVADGTAPTGDITGTLAVTDAADSLAAQGTSAQAPADQGGAGGWHTPPEEREAPERRANLHVTDDDDRLVSAASVAALPIAEPQAAEPVRLPRRVQVHVAQVDVTPDHIPDVRDMVAPTPAVLPPAPATVVAILAATDEGDTVQATCTVLPFKPRPRPIEVVTDEELAIILMLMAA